MNVDWNYIAARLANTFYKSGDLKNITRAAFAAYASKPQDYAPALEKDKRYKMIYNFVMTVSETPGLPDDNKVQTIYKLIGALNETAEIPFKKIEEIFKKGNYFNATAERLNNILDGMEKFKIPREYSSREFHSEVIKLSKPYFLQSDYFHAIKNACVGYNKKIHSLTGSKEDGYKLMGNVFGGATKILINPGNSGSEKDERDGFMYISMGVMKAFRNPLAHETPQTWPVSKEDCLDILSLLSLLFRRLDKAKIAK